MKHVRKPIALLLALVLAASLLCLPALAADTVPARYAKYRVYTCLGDSNAAGYAAAVPAVKRPLPQPSSSRSSRAWGISSRQFPRRS